MGVEGRSLWLEDIELGGLQLLDFWGELFGIEDTVSECLAVPCLEGGLRCGPAIDPRGGTLNLIVSAVTVILLSIAHRIALTPYTTKCSPKRITFAGDDALDFNRIL